MPALLWLPLWGRIAVAIALIAPLGLAMGMPFPGGLRRDRRRLVGGAAVLLGTERHHVCYRISDDGICRFDSWIQAAMLMGSACYLLAALASRMAFTQSRNPTVRRCNSCHRPRMLARATALTSEPQRK